MNILQLRQEQLPQLPFNFFLGLRNLKTDEPIAVIKGDYLIIPTDFSINGEDGGITVLANYLVALAKAKGFNLLMLKYV